MQFKVGFATDIGRKRQQNQDSGISCPELGLFVVADGMGGHKGGETASAMVIETVPEQVRSSQKKRGWDPRVVIDNAVKKANQAIYDRSQKNAELNGMGTTAVALLFTEGALTIGHVGDSRCYYFRPNAVWQLTRDHSLVQEKLRAGLINRAELKTDAMKNVITRSVGFEREVNVDVYEINVQPGDVFMICSDGLSGLVDDEQMLQIIQEKFFEEGDAEVAVRALIDAANENGGDDNITTVLVQVTQTDPAQRGLS